MLRYYGGLPLDEIATAMGCVLGTVKSTLHAAQMRSLSTSKTRSRRSSSMRRDDVAHALDALASEVPAPAADAASLIARGRRRIVRQRILIIGIAAAVVATAAGVGAANRDDTPRVVAPVPATSTTSVSPHPEPTATTPAPTGVGDAVPVPLAFGVGD